jgi:hypothetical protein
MTTGPTIITADLQLSDNQRDAYRFVLFPRLRAIMQRLAAKRLIILGDLTEEKDRHSGQFTNRIVNELLACAELAPVTVLQGNHDALDPAHPFFQFVGHMPGVEWLKDVTTRDLDGLGRCVFIPHVPATELWRFQVPTSAEWIFCHQTFAGADIGTRTLEGISPGIFMAHMRVIAGDIHVPQSFANITYVGAPYTVDFGDNYQGRLLLIRDDRLTSMKLTLPQKRLLDWPVEAGNGRLKAMLAKLTRGDIVKLRVHMTAADYPGWADIRREALQLGEHAGVVMHMVQPVVAERRPRALSVATAVQRSDADILREYGRRQRLDADTMAVGVSLCG